MAFDFPNSPAEGAVYKPAESSNDYLFSKGVWLGTRGDRVAPRPMAVSPVAEPHMGSVRLTIDPLADTHLRQVDIYAALTGQPFDRLTATKYSFLIPGAVGAPFVVTMGAAGIQRAINGDLAAAAPPPTLGRQWALSGGQAVHANTNLDNRVMTSSDGINWQSGTAPADATPQGWVAGCWSPELMLFVGVANAGGANAANRIMTSPDGLTWTLRTSAQTHAQAWVCWGGPVGDRKFVLVSSTTSVNHIQTSPDGITWTIRPTGSYSSALRGVCWSPELNLFVAVSSAATGQRVLTSPDGITWTPRNTPADQSWQAVIWCGAPINKFVAVANGGTAGNGSRVMTSVNGIDWVQAPFNANFDGNGWMALAWSPQLGRVVAVSQNGAGNRAAYSTDGVTWVQNSGANVGLQGVVWCGPPVNLFVAVSTIGGDVVYTSPDGFVWTNRRNASSASSWYGLAWAPELTRLAAFSNANAINPELLTWGGCGFKNGDRIRYGFDLVSGGPVARVSANPSRNVGSAFTGAGTKVSTSPLSTDADNFGVVADTNVAAVVDNFTIFKEAPGMLSQALWDFHCVPLNASGVEGPETLVSSVQVI